MKTTFFILVLLISLSGYSQDKEIQEPDSLKQKNLTYFNLEEPTKYSLDTQLYTFTPEDGRIHIKASKNSGEIDYGDLRRTTDDGLYIMTSPMNDQVSFGRFDSIGNFRTLRYDSEKDSVVEEWYMKEPLKNLDPDK